MDPFQIFQQWYSQEKKTIKSSIPSACCLSTIGLDGYPNARFVSLKDVVNGRFIVTGSFTSRKGREVVETARAALTFWWPATEKQVRVQGDVEKISSKRADNYFSERSRNAQIVSWISKQGEPLESKKSLLDKFQQFSDMYAEKEIPRPDDWTGFSISPIRIEFLTFSSERLHERQLFIRNEVDWKKQPLQP